MRKLTFETFNTEINKGHTEYRDTSLWILNHLNVSLMLKFRDDPRITKTQSRVFTGLILSACTTGANISRLIDPLSTTSKDCLPLARTFYETCLQAGLCLTDEGEISDRINYYTLYKSFKTQVKPYKLGTVTGKIVHPTRLTREHPDIKKALSIFEPDGRSNRIRPCFTFSRSDMIEKISSFCPLAGILLSGSEQMNWDISSEIAHGSFFGFEVSGGNSPLSSPDTHPIETFAQTATYVVMLCCDAVGRIIFKKFPELADARHLSEASILFYKNVAPEMADAIDSIER